MLCHRLYLNEEENIEKISTKIIIRNRHPIPWHHVHRLSCQPFTDGFTKTISRQTEPQAGPTETETSSTLSLIDASGMTLESRIHTSDGYTRTKEADGSLAEFLRNYAMEPDQSPVLLYDGSKNAIKRLMLPYLISHLNMRISSNARIPPSGYMQNIFWSTKQYDRIAFHFTNGFDAQYTKWADGYRIRVNGNNVSWIKSAQPDTSYDSLKDYLRIVFSYAGTASMDTEAQPIPLSDLQVGDVFLKAEIRGML